jgi:hypothetical protein
MAPKSSFWILFLFLFFIFANTKKRKILVLTNPAQCSVSRCVTKAVLIAATRSTKRKDGGSRQVRP